MVVFTLAGQGTFRQYTDDPVVPIRMKHHLFSDTSTGLNVVAIGGGNGLSTLLSGLKRFVDAEGNRTHLDQGPFRNSCRYR
jgi:hypothetical protein